ncbi:MAG: hypothetical protein V4482_05015 [Pseudomonadota bacterium]
MIKTLTKILMVGSTFATLSPAFAEAQAPSLKMSGFTSMVGLAADQTQKQNGKGGTDPSFAISSSDFRLTVGGKSITDFGYKYVVNFKTLPGQDPLVNRNYVEFDSNDIGSIQFGVVKGIDDSMVVDTYSILGGSGGNKGSVGDIYNYSEGVIIGTNLIGSTDTATKINWFSPKVSIAPNAGTLQIALSYTPNTSHNGKGARDNSVVGTGIGFGNEKGFMYPGKDYAPYGLKNTVYGITYANTIGDYTLTLNAVAVSEHSRLVMNTKGGSRQTYALNKTNSYQLSGMLSVKQWDFTGSWLDNKKSRLATAELLNASGDTQNVTIGSVANTAPIMYLISNPNYALGNSGQSWNVGTRYSFGAYQAALGYFRTDRKTDATQKASMDTITTTLDFKALEGLKFFGEVDYMRTKTNKTQVDGAQNYYNTQNKSQVAIGSNTGAVLMVGTKVSF